MQAFEKKEPVIAEAIAEAKERGQLSNMWDSFQVKDEEEEMDETTEQMILVEDWAEDQVEITYVPSEVGTRIVQVMMPSGQFEEHKLEIKA